MKYCRTWLGTDPPDVEEIGRTRWREIAMGWTGDPDQAEEFGFYSDACHYWTRAEDPEEREDVASGNVWPDEIGQPLTPLEHDLLRSLNFAFGMASGRIVDMTGRLR